MKINLDGYVAFALARPEDVLWIFPGTPCAKCGGNDTYYGDPSRTWPSNKERGPFCLESKLKQYGGIRNFTPDFQRLVKGSGFLEKR